jgi:hypothetical protein
MLWQSLEKRGKLFHRTQLMQVAGALSARSLCHHLAGCGRYEHVFRMYEHVLNPGGAAGSRLHILLEKVGRRFAEAPRRCFRLLSMSVSPVFFPPLFLPSVALPWKAEIC